ncbi:MAG TPA: hypothetical protein VG755_19640 [Nannocystaceae bacterium]|nr:hypothetical protein [Nannocystaceae bacterium]
MVLFGCAAADAGPIAPDREPPAAPTTPVVVHESTGWPSASNAEREQTRADFERVAAERERLERGGATTCVTPNATRTGDAQPDLRLELTGPSSMAKSDFPELKGTIRNVSKKRAHAIVMPGDGSDAGWRDPVIAFTAFIDEGDGCWKPLPRAAVGRCGLFDPDWSDEIVSVKAGTSRAIDPLWAWPHFEWKKGKVRLFVHYTWTGGEAEKGRSGGTRSVDLGAMAKEKPFELVSNALELEITA